MSLRPVRKFCAGTPSPNLANAWHTLGRIALVAGYVDGQIRRSTDARRHRAHTSRDACARRDF